MNVRFQQVELTKRYPLRISRGVITGSVNLFVYAEYRGAWGLGEMAPGTLTGCASAAEGQDRLQALLDSGLEGLSIHEIYARGREMDLAPCAQAALDIALWDALARSCGVSLTDLLGLPRHCAATSVTIGINPPRVIAERVPEMLARTGAKYLKVKLGSPDGVEADRESYLACREAARPHDAALRVDANGGWSLEEARRMCLWLAERDCEYVEQPLAEGCEDALPALFEGRPLPIFVDESCRFARDVPRWCDAVDGANVKLMKCGGITEALRIVSACRAHGLKTMIGCMGESSVSISAAAAIGGLFDHIDLDSHLNLHPDPARGAELADGVICPPLAPGHGAWLNEPLLPRP